MAAAGTPAVLPHRSTRRPPWPPRARGDAGASVSVAGVVGWGLLVGVPLAFLVAFFGWPVLSILRLGLLPEGVPDLSGFVDVFSRPRTWRLVGLTLGQAALGTIAAVVLGVPGAYVLYRTRFRGRRLVRGLVTVPFVLPTVVVGVAFRSLLAPGGLLGFLHLDGTLAAIVAALVFFNYAVVVRTVGGMWTHLDPRPAHAARTLGAPPWRTFLSVTLPSLAPAIASAAAVVFLYCASAFGIVLVLGGRRFGTIETEIYLQTVQYLDLRAAAVLSVAQLVIMVTALRVAAAARHRWERALRLATDKEGGRTGTQPRGGRPHLAATVLTAVVILGLLVLPMVSLAVRSLRTADGWGITNYLNLAGRGSDETLGVPVWEALTNSLRFAVDATVIAVLIGVAVSVVLSRRPRGRAKQRAMSALDTVFMLPLGVSAVTVGFGFLITLDRPPLDLRSSLLLVPIAQAVVAIPLVIRTVLPVLRAIDQRQREVASVLGANAWRVFRSVDAPILGRSLGLAVGFAFAISLGEFGATSFLARPDAPTLPVVIFRLIGRPGAENFGTAIAASVVLAAATATAMALAERMRVVTASEI
jgi:thiamine transport system permease protein